nr:hypothetical protein [Tanacetum cinerariifolium]
MVINSPWMRSKNWLVQKQTAFGRDTSNPFMADNLPKIVWFSTHHITCMKSWLVQKQTALGQTATGKESSNPFMAGSLPKIILYSFLHKICFHGVYGEFGLNAARLSKFPLSGKSVVKRSGDVTRLQALVDKKKIVISEEVIREILQLNDAEGVICLPNDEIFAGLARMGYEKPSTKLTFYNAFFSTQWKFFIYTILHSLSAKRTSWNEFSSAMASALICLSSGLGKVPAQGDEVQEPAAKEVTNDVVSPTPTLPSPSSPVLDTCSALVLNVEGLENANAAQQLEIVKLKARVKKLKKLNKVVTASTPIPTAKPKTLTITAAPDVSTRRRKGVVIRDPEEELHNDTPVETPTVKDKGKEILIEAPKPMKKKDRVEMDAENAALDHVQSKEPQYIKRYHGIKKKPQSESEARKNMISYLKNTEAKRRKPSEEAQEADDLKKRLEIIQDEDDDVFVEATPLAQKVPIMDYQVVVIDNKPKYKIIRADDTHQFY